MYSKLNEYFIIIHVEILYTTHIFKLSNKTLHYIFVFSFFETSKYSLNKIIVFKIC